jgi:hypothetical protein
MALGSMLAHKRAIAPPTQREHASISCGWIPRVSGPMAANPCRRAVRTSLAVTWAWTEWWKKRRSGVSGGFRMFHRYLTRRTTARYGQTKGSPLRQWEMISPLTPFLWVVKRNATALTARVELLYLYPYTTSTNTIPPNSPRSGNNPLPLDVGQRWRKPKLQGKLWMAAILARSLAFLCLLSLTSMAV